MDVLPLSLKLKGQPCLVVGGGEVARRKIELLAAAGANVTVVARRFAPDVRRFCESRGVVAERRSFAAADVADCLLVVAATDDADVNDEIARACARHRVLVNCVDDGERSTALFPAIVDRGPVTVAVSTGGASPTLARRLREAIEALLPAGTGRLATYLASRRRQIHGKLPDARSRQRFWDGALDGELAEAGARGDYARADAVLAAALAAPAATGFVSLVGAGPGDPDLLTVKALRCLQRADVVYYDNLVGSEILDRCRRDARRVYVGRHGGKDAAQDAGVRQDTINDSLVADARAGKRVVRLKGGDPLVFGRGGEEMVALAEHGVPFEVVPGVTAALACAAVAGVPLTHRDWSRSVRFVTGHRRDGEVNLDWPELAKNDQTLVVYMGLGALEKLCERLLVHGADASTPMVTVARGSLPGQQVVAATLGELAAKVRDAGLNGPATTIVGRVAGLASRRNDG